MQPFNIPLQEIHDARIENSGIQLFVLRTDLNHPDISGNKLFKLKYNLLEARKRGYNSLLTFGGAYSNHIAATAAAGKEHNFKTIGIIRGEKVENPTLSLAEKNGMELHFVSRDLYRDKEALYAFAKTLGDHFIIPEGGANEMGVKGCMEIISSVEVPFDTVCCACGTGTTLSGIILSIKPEQKALGFQVLKAENYIEKEVGRWLEYFNNISSNWKVSEEYHFGGYAKQDSVLQDFILDFEQKQGIPLDAVYTGKMMFGIYDLIKKGCFPHGEKLVAVHSGGLQGKALI